MSTTTYELSTGMELIDKPDSLEDLAGKIRSASSEAMRHATEATQGALIAGKLLLEAKEQVPHGHWDTWVTANCDVALRTAQAYMRLAKSVQKLDSPNAQRVTLLPLRQALKAIATDPTPTPHYSNIRAKKRTDAERAVSVFSKAQASLKATQKLIGYQLEVKGAQVKNLRQKLQAVLAELDALEVEKTEVAA